MKKLFINAIPVLVLTMWLFSSCQKEAVNSLGIGMNDIVSEQLDSDESHTALLRSTCGVWAVKVSEDGCCYKFNVYGTQGEKWTINVGDGTMIEGAGDTSFEHCYSGQSYMIHFICGETELTYTNGGCKNIEVSDPCEVPSNIACNADLWAITWDPVPGAVEYAVHFLVNDNTCGCVGNEILTPTHSTKDSFMYIDINMCSSFRIKTICEDGQSEWSDWICIDCSI